MANEAAKADTKLTIPPPRSDRQPLRVNLLNQAQKAGTSLAPLFPYVGAGSLVPASSLFIGGPEADYGHFYHHNSVDEIILAMVAKGGTLQTGQVYVGSRVHGVNSFLKNPHAPGSYVLFSVTQRQFEEDVAQPEGISVLCKACRAKLHESEFETSAPAGATELDQPFGTQRGCYEGMKRYNESVELRTCSKCGHVNDPFPTESWGWRRYTVQSSLMCEANQALREAAGAPREAGAEG